MENTISSFRGKYRFLSNFYEAPVTYNGLSYSNNEAAFQAEKCIELSQKMKFQTLDPSRAKRLGRSVKLRTDWEQRKTQVMLEACKAKFDQNPSLRKKLIETYPAKLEEGNTWGDRVWGTVNGIGENRLGLILMQIRNEYMQEDKAYNS